ncbi:MAG: damage-control phosphatase ARMT1 family protein [Promethearchaeota archaeon]
MKLHSECLACLIDQIRKNYQLLQPHIPDEQIVQTQKKIMLKLAPMTQKRMPYYSQTMYQLLMKEMGDDDPFSTLKREYNSIAEELIPELKENLKSAEDPLFMAINIAIIGNTVDFATPHSIQLEQDVQNLLSNPSEQLSINNYEQFKKDLKIAHKIFIIGDNCGEAVFDKILLEYLTKTYPEKEFIYGVRGGPVINDITKKEAIEIGIPEVCKVVEGAICPGVILEQSSPEYQEAFRSAEIILSKGQGNFEALDDLEIPGGSLYFLLKAKCNLVANIFKVPIGSLIFFHRTKLMDLNGK